MLNGESRKYDLKCWWRRNINYQQWTW